MSTLTLVCSGGSHHTDIQQVSERTLHVSTVLGMAIDSVYQRRADVYVETRLPVSGQHTVNIFEASKQPLSSDLYVKIQLEQNNEMVW